MANGSVARTAEVSLRAISWLVLLVGAVIGFWFLYLGITADEPWVSPSTALGGFTVTEDWQSAVLGILAAAYVAVVTGFVWSLTLLGRAVARYLEGRGV